MALRVVDANDRKRCEFFANAAAQLMDGVGVVAYGPARSGVGYEVLPVPPHLELDRVPARVATGLKALP